MTDEEFREKYGRDPVKPGQHTKVKVYWDRIIIAIILLVLLIYGVVKIISAVAGAFSGGGESSSKAEPAAAVSKSDSSSEENDSKEADKMQFTVCIDPGHGGDDAGAQNEEATRFEKDDNLALALVIRDELTAMGVNVVMTRDSDVFVELDDICKIANDANADLFVSLHRNSASAHFYGFEVWVNNHEPKADTQLAANILSAIDRVGISDNRNVNYGYIGDSQTNYQVNRQTHMPSCLVEMGFITNDEDNRLFDQNRDSYAVAIAEAVVKTAEELGIIDENGTRLIDHPYLSTKPQWDEKTQTYLTEDGVSVYADFIDPNAEDKNVKREDVKTQ